MQARILQLTQRTVGVTGRSHRSLPPSKPSAKMILLLELGCRINKQEPKGTKNFHKWQFRSEPAPGMHQNYEIQVIECWCHLHLPQSSGKGDKQQSSQEIRNNANVCLELMYVWMRSPKMRPPFSCLTRGQAGGYQSLIMLSDGQGDFHGWNSWLLAVVCPGRIASWVVAATTLSLHAQRWTKRMSWSCA